MSLTSWLYEGTSDPEPRPFTWGGQTKPTRAARRPAKTCARRRRGEPDGRVHEGTRRFW